MRAGCRLLRARLCSKLRQALLSSEAVLRPKPLSRAGPGARVGTSLAHSATDSWKLRREELFLPSEHKEECIMRTEIGRASCRERV